MTPEEIGGLILKMQDDDIQPREMRKFLEAVTQDEEVRRNARLAGKLSGLSESTRHGHCIANARFLLAHESLAPSTSEMKLGGWRDASQTFVRQLMPLIYGPWHEHINMIGERLSAAELLKRRGKRRHLELVKLQVSSHLVERLLALEGFWDQAGLLLD